MRLAPIYFEQQAERELTKIVSKNISFFILCDTNTYLHAFPHIEKMLPCVSEEQIIVIPAGEGSKNISTVTQIWETLLNANASKRSLCIIIGGGMVCDIGAFVVSTFKRGIPYIFIPTSLTAQIDAALGGKSAVNLDGIKNQIGLFSQPESIFIFHRFLNTLAQEDILSGFAEMIKHGLIADKKYFYQLQKILLNSSLINSSSINISWIKKSIQIKTKIVEKDFLEKHQRKQLNFGHTIGHALESFSITQKTTLSHGNAVAWGMLAESFLSCRKNLLSEKELKQIELFIKQLYNPLPFSKPEKEIFLRLIAADKKRENTHNFTLLKKIGKALINQPCSDEEILASIDYLYSV